MDNLPPLASLIAFDAVYRTGSVTKAASMLGRTHSAISKQLHQLQDHAGVTMFEKSGAGIQLTPDGRAFAQVVSNSLEDMRKAYHKLCGDDGAQRITIKVSSTFARLWAVPTVARFNIDHPEIEVQIKLTTVENASNGDGGVDLVLSWDRLTSPLAEHPNAISLGDVHIGPVLSPVYDHAYDGGSLRFQTRISRRGFEQAWGKWSELSGIDIVSSHETIYDLSALSYEAAERAMGVTLAPKFLIERELKEGSLIAPAGFVLFREGLLVRPSRERPRPSKHAIVFLDWLEENGRLGDDGFLAPTIVEPLWG
ncbi:LysR family transcriptional regulator [Cohaesibacter intestini]|uniref:LysR family transcriptional regulator n=1 Tax=Cohaesibacter intestini TaxID=2211145 RepID=UPI000DEB8C63|nr:LysR family transcriptional regulator [Cohaesibacter intestini]